MDVCSSLGARARPVVTMRLLGSRGKPNEPTNPMRRRTLRQSLHVDGDGTKKPPYGLSGEQEMVHDASRRHAVRGREIADAGSAACARAGDAPFPTAAPT